MVRIYISIVSGFLFIHSLQQWFSLIRTHWWLLWALLTFIANTRECTLQRIETWNTGEDENEAEKQWKKFERTAHAHTEGKTNEWTLLFMPHSKFALDKIHLLSICFYSCAIYFEILFQLSVFKRLTLLFFSSWIFNIKSKLWCRKIEGERERERVCKEIEVEPNKLHVHLSENVKLKE